MSARVEVEKILGETDNALHVELADGRDVWLPFSALDRVTRRPDGSASLVVADWLARKEDL